ncbi:MAG TPA: class I SAM-dependent methyltransferase [Candidatus Limnocylindria bacterium]|nr:class I SAM-dependent methyltransferase [Candidatus Limnocylindria bacterium]
MGDETAPDAPRSERNSQYRRSLRATFNRRRFERVMELVNLGPRDRILDLGCGRGRKGVAYYNRVNPIVGVDRLPPEMIDRLSDNFRYVRGNASDLKPFADRSFDVVVSFGLLEHLNDDEVRRIAADTPRLAGRFAHVVPHPLAFVEPHTRMPLFGRWPAGLRSWYVRFFARGKSADYWEGLVWRSSSHWRALFGDSDLRITSHWYGPLLLYQIVYGGRLEGPSALGG